MKSKLTVEACIYALVIAASLLALAMVAASYTHYSDTKPVYQGF